MKGIGNTAAAAAGGIAVRTRLRVNLVVISAPPAFCQGGDVRWLKQS
jgi:hypothetical protein